MLAARSDSTRDVRAAGKPVRVSPVITRAPGTNVRLPAVRGALQGFRLRHPAQLVVFAFAVAVAIGTVLLALPVSRAGDGSAPHLVALSTSTSAVCLT